MLRFLIRQSATLAFIEALALLFAISWLDLATGHQVSLVLFYTAPIVFAVWLCDNKSVFVIAGLAGVLWSWADLALGHSYSSGTVQAWEIAIRFAFFLLIGLAGIGMREKQHASDARISSNAAVMGYSNSRVGKCSYKERANPRWPAPAASPQCRKPVRCSTNRYRTRSSAAARCWS